MEIIGNISKQKVEINKILSDTRILQKDMNNMNGRLDRSFTVVDELVFKVCFYHKFIYTIITLALTSLLPPNVEDINKLNPNVPIRGKRQSTF